MHSFEQYLQQHNLAALDVSLAAKVRYMSVWNATKGHPITPEHARKIRQAAFDMTGIAYTDSFALTEPEPVEDMQTIAIKKISRK